MDNSQEKPKAWVLERVKKLLALGTNDGATDGERDTAMRMAHRLLAKYNLSIAEAEATGGPIEENRGVHRAQFFGRPWARVCAQAAAKLFFCEYVYMSASRASQTIHYFIGRESNTITAAGFAEYLVKSILREARVRNRDEGEDSHLWMRSFCVGAVMTIHQRVEKMILDSKDQKTDSPKNSIVLASVYEQERKKNLELRKSNFPKRLKGRTGSREISDEGAASGREYGGTVSLNRQLSSPSRDPGLLLTQA